MAQKSPKMKTIKSWGTSSSCLQFKLQGFEDGNRELVMEELNDDGDLNGIIVMAVDRSELEEVIHILESVRAHMPSLAEVQPGAEEFEEEEEEEEEDEEDATEEALRDDG